MIGIWKYITVLATGSDQLVELLLSENGLIVQSCSGQCEVVIWHHEEELKVCVSYGNGAQDELKIQE
jgi:hypothetical protein